MLNSILITGVTDLECYPKGGICKYYKQGMLNQVLCLPESKPDIESINEIKVDIDVIDFKIINTILGPKILIYGCISIKAIYTADNCQQSVHSANWHVNFCDFVLLNDLSYDRCNDVVTKVFGGIEDVCVKLFNRRIIDLSILYIICPQFITHNSNYCCNKQGKFTNVPYNKQYYKGNYEYE